MPKLSSLSVTGLHIPDLNRKLSVTINALFLSISVLSSSRASAVQPFLIYTFSGTLNQSMFSLLIATVLILSRCLMPTFSLTELPPHVPQPSVSEGSSLKL